MEMPGEKLGIRLLEVLVEKGVGNLLKPWSIRREGRAQIDVERDRMLMLAQVECDRMEILERPRDSRLLIAPERSAKADSKIEPTFDVDDLVAIARACDDAELLRREIAVARAVIHAQNELGDETTSSAETAKIDEDWLRRWRDCAAEVNSETLQALWGKVLAGEFRSPGRYSLRTVAFLRDISSEEAQAIDLLSPFVASGFLYKEELELEAPGLFPVVRLLELQNLGILEGVDAAGLSQTIQSEPHEGPTPIFAKDWALLLHNDTESLNRPGFSGGSFL